MCRRRLLRYCPWRGGRYARSVALSPQFDLYRSCASNARRSSPTAVTRIPNREKVPLCLPRTGASSLRALVRWGRRGVGFNKCSFESSKLLPPSVWQKYFLITHTCHPFCFDFRFTPPSPPQSPPSLRPQRPRRSLRLRPLFTVPRRPALQPSSLHELVKTHTPPNAPPALSS